MKTLIFFLFFLTSPLFCSESCIIDIGGSGTHFLEEVVKHFKSGHTCQVEHCRHYYQGKPCGKTIQYCQKRFSKIALFLRDPRSVLITWYGRYPEDHSLSFSQKIMLSEEHNIYHEKRAFAKSYMEICMKNMSEFYNIPNLTVIKFEDMSCFFEDPCYETYLQTNDFESLQTNENFQKFKAALEKIACLHNVPLTDELTKNVIQHSWALPTKTYNKGEKTHKWKRYFDQELAQWYLDFYSNDYLELTGYEKDASWVEKL